MNRPTSPFHGSYNWNETSSYPPHDHVRTKDLKQGKNSSFKNKVRAAVRKIGIVCSKSKPKDDVLEADVYEVGRSSQINTNSSGFSSGSKKRGSSPFNPPRPFESPKVKHGDVYGSLNFSLVDIQKATNNFSEVNIIGEGGFGTVFKGQLQDGTLVAVKRARKNLSDKRAIQEFRSEILAFSKIEHLNLVKFYGYLEHPIEKIIVVEYVGNGTLYEQLHGNQGYAFELGERLDIAIDVAHAVTYLHSYNDPPIIHRDIKASNVLITEKYRAKVADFGLARLVPDGDGHDVTHISTHVKGTIGYMDPEYMKTYQLTEKSDVYSFGVLLVELVTGRHPLEPQRAVKERMTTPWALRKLRDGIPVLAMDPRLQRSPASIKAVENILKLALECTRPLRQSRPSMKECVEALWAIRKDLRGGAEFTPRRSADDLLEAETRRKRQNSLGIQGDIYPFMSA